jgi:glucose/arabinose dehydrogenase
MKMRRPPIYFVFPALALLCLAACSPQPQPVSTSVQPSQPAPADQTPARSLPTLIPTSGGEPSPTVTVIATQPASNAATPTPASSPVPANPSATATAGSSTLPAAPSRFPDPGAFTWQAVANGLVRPTDLTGDGFGRLLAVEQPGDIRVIQNGVLRDAPFLDITDRVGSAGDEQGLLGLALHPRYASNGYFYVNYTDRNGNTVIARFTADPAGASARADSEKILLRINQPYPNHNGGSMKFGPDGYLYMGLGDGGSGGDPQGNGQNTAVLLGKILRIDVDGGDPYAIPPGNPFVNGGGRPEIWAYGLRNPWRISFDSLTSDLYIADVGQNTWEEVDFQPAGAKGGINYGWNYMEGNHPYQGEPPEGMALTLPVAEYQHPTGCSITGGMVYRGKSLPEFYGIYLYADFCSGKIWGLFRAPDGTWKNQLLFDTSLSITSFGQDDQGELYLLDQGAGAVLKLQKK